MIVIDTKKLINILDKTPAMHNIMLVGRHGIGKSEILTNYYQEKGLKVVTLFLGQMSDPGDLIGLPEKSHGRMEFIPPYWFPVDNQPIVLFLDELNRARPEILQSVMDLTLNRCLAGHMLPKGSRIISAINDGDEYQLTMLDPALVSRFNIYEFRPTIQEWLLWASKQDLDQRVIDFIEGEPAFLDGLPEQRNNQDTGLERYPDRRAWRRVSDIVMPLPTLSDDDLELIAGVVGASAASRFYAFVQGRKMLSGIDILKDFSACESLLRQYRLHQMAIVTESIFRQLELSYDITADNSLQTELYQLYASNFKAYYNFLEDTEQRETIAFTANLFQSGSYQNAILFITNLCPELYNKMIEFIATL